MKLFDKFRHTGSNSVNQPPIQTPKDQKPVITSTIIETGETVEFSQEKLEKASQDLGEFKKTLEGKSDEEKSSLVKDFVSNHKDVSLALVALAGLQFGATTAQGFNHKEVMKSMENLKAKLDAKNLKKLCDNNYSAEVTDFIAGKHDVEKEIDKLKTLNKADRLYKSTPMKGFMKSMGTAATGTLLTFGPPTAAVLGIIEWGSIGDGFLGFIMGVGGIAGTIFSNMINWSSSGILDSLTKDGMQYNTPIGPMEALDRLEKHKTVKIKQAAGKAKYDKIDDLSRLSIID